MNKKHSFFLKTLLFFWLFASVWFVYPGSREAFAGTWWLTLAGNLLVGNPCSSVTCPIAGTYCAGGPDVACGQCANNGGTNVYEYSYTCMPDCTPTSWAPDPSTVCSGQSFTQTSNCGTTRVSTGTKSCPPPAQPAIGNFDGVNASTCSVTGWAFDPDASSQSIDVHVYRDASAFSGGSILAVCSANTSRPDVNSAHGISGNHGFSCNLPASYKGTGAHNLYIHAIDVSGNPNNVINSSPKSLSCAASCTPNCSSAYLYCSGTPFSDGCGGTCIGTAACSPPPPPPVTGSCGPAATVYAYNQTSFSGSFCSSGTPPSPSPSFPAQGASVFWTCSGSGGGWGASCSASRNLPPGSTPSCSITPVNLGSGLFRLDYLINWGPSYTLMALAGGSSFQSIVKTGSPQSGSYNVTQYGTSTYTITPLTGFSPGPPPLCSTSVSGPATVTLTVTKSGSGTGTVSSNPSGINCGSTCTYSFPANSTVTLTEIPGATTNFAGWSGACSGTGTTCTLVMDGPKSVGAQFNAATATLTVTKSGSGVGTVSSNPSGINCGSTCTYSFPLNSSITLTEVPGASSNFIGWSGACSGTGTTCTLVMDGAKSVTTQFNAVPICTCSGSATDHCTGEYWSDSCGNVNACGPGTKDCRKFWEEVAP